MSVSVQVVGGQANIRFYVLFVACTLASLRLLSKMIFISTAIQMPMITIFNCLFNCNLAHIKNGAVMNNKLLTFKMIKFTQLLIV